MDVHKLVKSLYPELTKEEIDERFSKGDSNLPYYIIVGDGGSYVSKEQLSMKINSVGSLNIKVYDSKTLNQMNIYISFEVK